MKKTAVSEAHRHCEKRDDLSKRGPLLGALLRHALERRHVLAALAGQVFASGTNFGTSVIIGRFCLPEGLGQYWLAFNFLIFMLEMQNALISTPYMVFAPRLKGEAHARYTGSALLHQLLLCAAVSCVCLGAAMVLSLGFGPAGLAPVAWMLVFAGVFFLLRDHMRRLLFANMQMLTALLCDGVVACLQLGGLLLLAACGLLTPGRAFAVIGAAAGMTFLVWYLFNRKLFHFSLQAAKTDFLKNLSFSKWVFASGLLWSISITLYPYIIAFFHDAATVGVWGACFGTVALGNILMMGVQNFLGPRIAMVYAQEGAQPMKRYVFFASFLFALPLAMLALALWFLGDWLVTLLYADDFAGNGVVVGLLGMNLFTLALAFPFSRGLFILERADVDFYVNFVVLFVLLALGLWLVRSYALVGAACGLLIANVAALCTRSAAFFYCTQAVSRREAS